MLKADISSFSLPGKGNNFDAVAHCSFPSDGYLLAIADGVGSARFGGETARLAVSTCTEFGLPQSMPQLFAEVSKRVQAASGLEPEEWSSTLSVCWIHGDHAMVGHVGDTRIYHLRGQGLKTRTRDQTEVARLIEEGVLTRERALRYPRRNVLLSSLNGRGNLDLYQSEFDLQDRDRLLLLSDGIYRQVSKREIVALSKQHADVEAFIDALKALVTERGLIDDSSALCAELHHF